MLSEPGTQDAGQRGRAGGHWHRVLSWDRVDSWVDLQRGRKLNPQESAEEPAGSLPLVVEIPESSARVCLESLAGSKWALCLQCPEESTGPQPSRYLGTQMNPQKLKNLTKFSLLPSEPFADFQT